MALRGLPVMRRAENASGAIRLAMYSGLAIEVVPAREPRHDPEDLGRGGHGMVGEYHDNVMRAVRAFIER